MKTLAKSLVVTGLVALVSGCQYYSVSSPESTKDYITYNWACRKSKDNAKFVDLKTGKEMRLMNSTLQPIPFDEALAELAAANTMRPPHAISQVRIDQARRPVSVGGR